MVPPSMAGRAARVWFVWFIIPKQGAGGNLFFVKYDILFLLF